MNSEKFMPNLYLALTHYPVVNKRGEIIASALTNLDLHDIARVARTYGVKGYYVITPLEDQRELAGAEHGEGGHRLGGPVELTEHDYRNVEIAGQRLHIPRDRGDLLLTGEVEQVADRVLDALQTVLDQVTPEDAVNCYKHCGYTLQMD